jgi:hypothetical protein
MAWKNYKGQKMTKKKSLIKNRIVKYDVKPADQFTANPHNFRRHPENQRDAVQASLKKIGWITGVIENVRTGNLIDGHERVMQALENNDDVPYIQVDLTEDEENLMLAIFDKMTEMAYVDESIFEELKSILKVDDEILAGLVESVNPFVGEGFARPEFDGLVENVADNKPGISAKNGNWFYVEYYGDDDRYNKLSEMLAPFMAADKQLNSDKFYEMVSAYVNAG